MTDFDPYAGVTAEKAVRGVLAMAGFPMGPDEAASRSVEAVRAFDAKTLPVCACGYLVAICEHRQPWRKA